MLVRLCRAFPPSCLVLAFSYPLVSELLSSPLVHTWEYEQLNSKQAGSEPRKGDDLGVVRERLSSVCFVVFCLFVVSGFR